jgi:hypothetical protein
MIGPLSAAHLLEIWERGANRTPIEQALIILDHAFSEAPAAWLEKLTIGQRDLCLLRLRELTFGSHIHGIANCPACHERLELTLEMHDLLASDSKMPDPDAAEAANSHSSFKSDSYEISFRLPSSADLRALTADADQTLARQKLLEACLLSASHAGETVKGSELPPHILEAVIGHMAQADPIANLTIVNTCPACGHRWEMLFDIGSYFWAEISAWAVRIMHEVHLLASAYGWREADILAMSARRRQGYLELTGVYG